MRKPSVVQLGSNDLVGQRFNGQDLTKILNGMGMPCHHLVWSKAGFDSNTTEMFNYPGRSPWRWVMEIIENYLSIRSLLQFWTFFLPFNKFFRRANVLHLHLLHWPSYFSILALPFVTRGKRTFWTIHDCWAFTGHCIYPFSCERWKIGCGKCEFKNINFKIERDTTRFMFKVKKWIYAMTSFEVIVASQFMYDMVSTSPIFKNKKIHLIPFGIDLSVFKPLPSSAPSRKALFGFDEDALVIGFRAADGQYKGLENIKEALRLLKLDRKICLLNLSARGLMEDIGKKFRMVELGWVNDLRLTVDAYQAMDVFLMPSHQEAFGMMAIEAMACGVPVITFSGTALPQVIGGNECGMVVPQGNSQALCAAIEKLLTDDELRKSKSKKGRAFVEAHYKLETHVQKLVELYTSPA